MAFDRHLTLLKTKLRSQPSGKSTKVLEKEFTKVCQHWHRFSTPGLGASEHHGCSNAVHGGVLGAQLPCASTSWTKLQCWWSWGWEGSWRRQSWLRMSISRRCAPLWTKIASDARQQRSVHLLRMRTWYLGLMELSLCILTWAGAGLKYQMLD